VAASRIAEDAMKAHVPPDPAVPCLAFHPDASSLQMRTFYNVAPCPMSAETYIIDIETYQMDLLALIPSIQHTLSHHSAPPFQQYVVESGLGGGGI
jgi:hypothetical protein